MPSRTPLGEPRASAPTGCPASLGEAAAVGPSAGLRFRSGGSIAAAIGYDGSELDVNGTRVALGGRERLDLHVFLDKPVLEVFADGRREVVTRVT